MINVNKIRYAYGSTGDTVSIAWAPVENELNVVKVAFAVRNKSDMHNKSVVRQILNNRILNSEDNEFVFYYRPTFDTQFAYKEILSYGAMMQAVSYAVSVWGKRYAIKFVNERYGSVHFSHVYPIAVFQKKVNAPKPTAPINNAPYQRNGQKIYFMHDVEYRYSLGWTFDPVTEKFWFSIAACRDGDAFSREIARKVIMNSKGVEFGAEQNAENLGYNDFLLAIHQIVYSWYHSRQQFMRFFPDCHFMLAKMPKPVIERILMIPHEIERRGVSKYSR